MRGRAQSFGSRSILSSLERTSLYNSGENQGTKQCRKLGSYTSPVMSLISTTNKPKSPQNCLPGAPRCLSFPALTREILCTLNKGNQILLFYCPQRPPVAEAGRLIQWFVCSPRPPETHLLGHMLSLWS